MIDSLGFSQIDLSLPVNRSSFQNLGADVVLGVLGKKCRGLGVCKIAPLHSLAVKCSVMHVDIAKMATDILRFRFDPSALCAMRLKRQFDRGIFTVEEDFFLPDFVCEYLQLDQKWRLQGQYRFVVVQEYFDVFFPLDTTSDFPAFPGC